jgi:hypothetical protein
LKLNFSSVAEPHNFCSVVDLDPGSGAFLPQGSGMILFRISDPRYLRRHKI